MSRQGLAVVLMALGVVALLAGIALFYVTPLASAVARLAGRGDASAVEPVAIALTLGGLALGVLGAALESEGRAGDGPGKTEAQREAELRRAHGDDGDPGDDLDFDLD